jgi:hypothetical protein
MVKIIMVHESSKGREILLNADQIEYAQAMEAQRGTRTEVRMTNEKLHHLQESLEDVFALCRAH